MHGLPPQLGPTIRRWLALAVLVLATQGCVYFRAAPGEQPLVGDINFEGNKEIPDGELRGRIALTSSGYRFVFKFGEPYTFESAGLKADRQRIERYYQSQGFYSARVTDVRTEPKDGRMKITFVIDEGLPTITHGINVNGLDQIPAKLRRKVFENQPIEQGTPFKEGPYEATKILLRERLAAEGYMKAEVEGRVDVDTDKRIADVTFDVKTGPLFRVGRIRIDGILGPEGAPDVSFDRTKDASLLRQGEVVTPQTINRARDKVAAMGVFSTVDVTPDFDDRNGIANILIKVTEAPFQTIESGVGIEIDQLRQLARASVRYTNKNIGRGQQKLILGASVGYAYLPSIFHPNPTSGLIGDLSAQYIQPRIFRRSIDAQATVDYTKDLLPAFRFQRIGVRGGLLMYLDNIKGLSFAPSINYEYYFDVGSGPGGGNDAQNQTTALVQSGCGPDPKTKNLATQCIIGYVEGQLNYDLRDNVLQPRKGAFFSFNVQYAGLPLSDFKYIRYLPEGRLYFPIPYTGKKLIFAARARWGLLQNLAGTESGKRQPPGFAYFFGGGANSVRPAGTQQLGPLTYTVVDASSSNQKRGIPFAAGVPIPLGGDHMAEGSLELRWYSAFGLENLGLALFFDAGRIYTLNQDSVGGAPNAQPNTQYGPGFGFRYNTPLGPLRVDLAFRRSSLDVKPAAVDISGVTNKAAPSTPPLSTNPNDYKIALDCPKSDPFTCFAENRVSFYLTLGEAF